MQSYFHILTEHIHWGIWASIGILLVAFEIIAPNFVVIWFGLGALVVAATNFFFDTKLYVDLAVWGVSSLGFLGVYTAFFKVKGEEPAPTVGQSEGEYAGIRGKITKVIEEGRYEAFFDIPVLGDRKWIVESDETLSEGDAVEVKEVIGQIVKVKKIDFKEKGE